MAGYDDDRGNIIPMFPDRWVPPRMPKQPSMPKCPEPWILPRSPRPVPSPRIIPMPTRPAKDEDDGSFPVSRAEVEEAQIKDDEIILKPVRLHINKTLLKYGFRVAVSIKTFNLTQRHIEILIKEYTAAGFKVKHNRDSDDRPGGDSWDNLEFS